jgi:hypothetical protein
MSAVSADLAAQRHRIYGVRVADDPQNPASFVVVCPLHKLIGRNLSLVEARTLLTDHELTHSP